MQLSNGRIQKPGNDTLLIPMPCAKEMGFLSVHSLKLKDVDNPDVTFQVFKIKRKDKWI